MYNIRASFAAFWRNLIPQQFKQRGGIKGGFKRLPRDVGRMEKAHIQLAAVSEGSADLPSYAGRGQAICALLHQIGAAGNISAGRRDAAAGIFDQ